MRNKNNITTMRHPDYTSNYVNFLKYRATYEGGKAFVTKYLERFSLRETIVEFTQRQKITYCPAHAKAAVIDIKNAIFQRMSDIIRKDGPQSYMAAITGAVGGVTRLGDTMTSFMGNSVLPELLVMSKVGVYIDNGIIPSDGTLIDSKSITPYLYIYPREQILAWSRNTRGTLTSLLLQDYTYAENEYGLTTGKETFYRLYNQKVANKITFQLFDTNGNKVSKSQELNLKQIPFVMGSLDNSLLIDVCDYQIALLNLASSDINYALKSNFPFYIEQYDARVEALMNSFKKSADAAAIDENSADTESVQASDRNNIGVGVSQGRRYPKDTDAPQFIHPSPEPLIASMKKQEELKQDIRLLVNLALSTIAKRDGSAESKSFDERGLEAGLSCIGLTLEKMERQIADIWCDYESTDDQITLIYPKKYDLKTDAEKRKEAKETSELISKVPSPKFQKDMTIEIADILMSNKVSAERFAEYKEEIEAAEVIITDPDVIQKDHEEGFVSTEFASQLRGYPEGQVDQAKKDHAERLARISIAQSKKDPQARGVVDAGFDPKASKGEKVNTEE